MSVRKRLTKHGETRWQVDYRDGAGVRRHRQFTTKGEAVAFAAKSKIEILDGTHTADSASITVAQAGELWLARARRENLERGTVLYYEEHVKLHINPFLGPTKLSRLSVATLTHFRDTLLDHGRSADMTRRVLTSLSGIISTAQQRGLASINNVPRIERKRRKRRDRRPTMPSREELQSILGAIEDLRDRVVILLGLLAGLRGSEMRGLPWTNVDLKAGVLRVRQRADRWNHIGAPKSGAGIRDIPLGSMLLNALKAWRLQCPPNALDLVLPAADGDVEQHISLLRHIFWPLQLRAGVTREHKGEVVAKYGLHALRHGCAALWISQGFNAKRIQVLMGHASIQETYDTYGYLLSENEADERGELDSLTARLLPEFK
jgi:integrase